MKQQLIGVCWLMTTKCNLKCPICYRYRRERGSFELRTKKRVADKLFDLDIKKVTFAGGEPLLDPDIVEIIKYVSDLGIKTALCTNGYFLSPEVLSRFDVYLNELTVPLDGSNSQIHSYSRGTEESFALSTQLLRTAKAFGVDTDVSTVLSKFNAHDMYNILRLVLKSGVRKWKIFQFYPLEDGWKNKDYFEISQEEFSSISKELRRCRLPIEIDIRAADDETMLSYFHISPNGRMLLVDKHRYKDIGDFLDCDDVRYVLTKNRFNFLIHCSRHWRDL